MLDFIRRLRRVTATSPETAPERPEDALLVPARQVIARGDEAVLSQLDDEFIVAAVRARSSVNESLVYAHHVFAETAALLRQYLDRRAGAVLEIGPGANLGVLFCFAAAGVERLAGIDIAEATAPSREFYNLLRDYISCVEGWKWWRQFSTGSYPHVSFPQTADNLDVAVTIARIDYRAPVSSAALSFRDGEFDAVYSVAALEHVDDPAGTVREIARVLRPGGVAVHEIDLKHHGAADPLRFLEWSDQEWLARTERYGGGRSLERILDGSWTGEVYCNRLRHDAWIKLFGEAGLNILLDEPLVIYEAAAIDPRRFHAPFDSMSAGDLSVLAFRLVARKE